MNNLNKLDIKTATLPSKTIQDLVHSSLQSNIVFDADVYGITCMNCELKCIGETSRNHHVRPKEHKSEIRIGNLINDLLHYISQCNHNFDFNPAKKLIYFRKKRRRRILRPVSFQFVLPEILVRVFIFIRT